MNITKCDRIFSQRSLDDCDEVIVAGEVVEKWVGSTPRRTALCSAVLSCQIVWYRMVASSRKCVYTTGCYCLCFSIRNLCSMMKERRRIV